MVSSGRGALTVCTSDATSTSVLLLCSECLCLCIVCDCDQMCVLVCAAAAGEVQLQPSKADIYAYIKPCPTLDSIAAKLSAMG